MNNTYYGVYCKGLLAVKTNINNFRWIYGSAPLTANEEEYQKCLVKVNVTIAPEKKLERMKSHDRKFQAYTWDENVKMLCCRRTLFGLPIGYTIRMEENTIHAEIGKNYYKCIKGRTMNLHGSYYLLSDLVNIVLLNYGYLTLYASAVADVCSNRGTVIFAPPNAGKTLTATMLCQEFGRSLVGEDIVITDGTHLYGCHLTNSYRGKNGNLDSAGAVFRNGTKRGEKLCDMCDVTKLAALSLGKPDVNADKDEMLRQIKILNGYLFNYYSSPIVKILGYFDRKYDISWEERAAGMLRDMAEHCMCHCIRAENAMDFYHLIGDCTPNGEE